MAHARRHGLYPQAMEVQPPRSRAAARADPRRGQRAVRRARLRRGLGRGHRQLRPASPGGSCTTTSAAARRSTSRCSSGSAPMREEQIPPPVGRSARARLADTVSRWLDWTEQNRTIWLATLGRGEDIADPDVRAVVLDLVRRAVAILAAHYADIADDTPRLRYALECWTGLNRAATRRWLPRRSHPRADPRTDRATPRIPLPHPHPTQTKPAHLEKSAGTRRGGGRVTTRPNLRPCTRGSRCRSSVVASRS